jgi:hypothetical protein
MDISINLTATAKQEARLLKVLASVNADRAREGQPQFEDVNTYLAALLVDAIGALVRRQRELEEGAIARKYSKAAAEVQAQVESILAPISGE